MIELAKMAKLVNNNIVSEVRRQKRELVTKVEIAFARTATPPRALVADADAVVNKSVAEANIKPRKMLQSALNERSRLFSVQLISPPTRRGLGASYAPSNSYSPPNYSKK